MSARLRAWFRAAPVTIASAEVNADDGELVRRFAEARDEVAFAELVRRHGPMVLATCRRVLHPDVHTADDAFQATFLVLATRAATVSPPERVGAWLYGVAVHVAKKARAWARKLVSSAAVDFTRVPVPSDASDPDVTALRAKIDDVLAGLPTKYRSPIVLCDLEQRSRAEAAGLLGWSEGTLSGRLSRARKLLADRLSRRGVAVPAAGLGVLLPASAALATVPAQLAASTFRSAVLVAVGVTAGDGIPAPVAALVQGVPMHTTTFKLFAAGVTGVALALGAFGLHALIAADPPAPAQTTAAPLAAPAATKGWGTKYTFTYKSAVTAVVFGLDLVAAGDVDGVLILWDTMTGKESETLLEGAEAAKPINHLQISPDSAWLYLMTNDNANRHQVGVPKKDRIFPGTGGNENFKAYGVTADGEYWLQTSASDEHKNLRLLKNNFANNVLTSENEGTFRHKEKVDLAAAGEADVVATISDGVLRRWDKTQAKPVWEEKLEKFEATVLVVCPSSKAIAVGGKNGEVRVYAGLTGKVQATLKGHKDAVNAIAFSADGKQVVTGGADKTARVYDAETGKERAVLKGHTDAVTTVAFNPGGEMIVTGSSDKTVRVWEFKE
ncbi:sigma-70 family rna polymerase sigma factor : Uncultured bacterium genome assembly Metasoil_fosmids_resub OS=uncultured bacterium PE=4 SV=1: Sigma70_r2: Sigma70_r4_2: WD40: WD40 [Gemmata massiliana]|uniref:Uncharacterized protein n=1 Tax=Gemmata massiliana TaxID=1210884 RepID=A0A6P2DJK2_9BACT|nr:sigma-70 family RNA polymerase sigma factor [Gemmata massiliana]VTS03396.1 sigma-70 family rna polymerase sigma factor : Uncultured bacterium genome assembly Metasoil_fosmids_resub OS=uncultured bacterium PE=4 SV=1: Sigma70_r2: Sigma70_r4_2: WD40: WD40 [Gemmata massiliana]